MPKRILRIGTELGLLVTCLAILACPHFNFVHAKAGDDARDVTPEATELPHTTVSATLSEGVIDDGKNVVWCGTFQLVWNEVRALTGGKLQLEGPQPPIATALERTEFAKADLSEDCYIAAAGYVGDGIFSRIDRLMKKKFPGADRHLAPARGLTPRPQDIVAYSYLLKNLRFATPFEHIDVPLDFGGKKVDCFGMGYGKPGHAKMSQQVKILDYQSPELFTIELLASPADDHLILAKGPPARTLAATWQAVDQRIAAAPQAMSALPSEVLMIPRMKLEKTRSYGELVGRNVITPASRWGDSATILAADQYINFAMNERGVRLLSESRMSIGCAAEARPVPQHRMEFDKPFLVVMRHGASHRPYFVCWVRDPEFMIEVPRH